MRIAVVTAAFMLASAGLVSASPIHSISPQLNYTPLERVQAQPKQNPEQKNQADQKAKQNQGAPKAAPKKDAMPKKDAAPKKEAKKDDTTMQKVKRTWRRWTTPSHAFCVRCPIPIPFSSKTCTAKGKTVDAARNTCIQQNPLCYVTAGKC